ncbi:MAG: ABC transporter permease [Egibacteraceae bacterium]
MGGRLADDLRAVRVVWQREVIGCLRNRPRMVIALLQPVTFLLLLGPGLARIVPPSAAHIDYRTFLFPGVLVMAVQFSAVSSGASIVWDREMGFLREMLVAPVRRSALVVGKCLGGSTVAVIQGTIMLALAGLVDVPYEPGLLVTLVAGMAVTAFAMTAFGALLATTVRRFETFQVAMNFLVMPMFFLSGAMFPLSGLPRWLTALALLNPLTYAVDALRQAVFSHAATPHQLTHALASGRAWGPWHLPAIVELVVVALFALGMLALASRQFCRPD